MAVTTGVRSDKVRTAGTGAIWRAPAGSIVPSDSTTAWGAGWVNLGYASDGFTIKPNFKTKQIRGWQSLGVLRQITTEFDFNADFELEQTDINSVALAWGGATIVPGTAGAYTLTLPSDPSGEFMIGLDWSDGVTSQRIIISRAVLSTLPTVKYVRTDGIMYAFSIQTLIPADGSGQIRVVGSDSNVSGV